MGKYDNITERELKSHLTRFARMVLRMESRGTLLDSLPDLMQFLGELRRMVFAYEVRGTRRDGDEPSPSSRDEDRHEEADPTVRESLRVVEEALERARELQERLEGGLLSDDPDDE
jgi:hypothetical protein